MESRVLLNERIHADRNIASKVRVSVPLRRPGFLVPPISWFIKPRERKTLQLDPLGSEVFSLIGACRTVGEIVDRFAEKHRLTFHESRVSVTQYISHLVDNGIAVVAMPKETSKEDAAT